MTDDRRLENLEAAVRVLRDELASLRAEVARGRAAPPGHAAPDDVGVAALLSDRAPAVSSALPSAERPVERSLAAPSLDSPSLEAAERSGDASLGVPPRLHHGDAATPAPHHLPASPTTAPRGFRLPGGARNIESLVGRYATLALATLTILMGVGAFLSWAIANAELGPSLRVGLGVVLAAGTAATGWWLRRRGTTRFGNTLLGLALAIVHVDAWGAGPNLQLVPTGVALATAAIASAALAVLAWRSGEETLFAVGTGGALLAPFVTSAGGGDPLVLLTYGWLVIAAALLAMRGRPWRTASRMTRIAIAAYTVAGASATADPAGALERLAPTVFATTSAWAALALSGPLHRRHVTRSALLAATGALLVAATGAAHVPLAAIVAAAAAISATGWLSLHLRTDEDDHFQPVDAVAIPLGALGVTLLALPAAVGARGATLALAWSLAAAVVSYGSTDRRPKQRELHALTAGFAAALAIVLALRPETSAATVGLAAYAAAIAWLAARLRLRLLAAPALTALLAASTWAYDALAARPAFGYTPFLTHASALALATVLGWFVFTVALVRFVGRADGVPPTPDGHAVLSVPAALTAFLWGHEELARAGSPELATFLLILYYAVVGVGTIFVGRLRGSARVRQAGLALAIFAAIKALVGTSDIGRIGLRVGSYLLVGAFLLAVAYWYRAAGDDDRQPAERPA